MSGQAPLVYKLTAPIPATAQGATAVFVVGEAPFAGTVTGVSYTPVAAIAGAATNSRTFNAHNRGDDGNDTTVIATLAMVADVNAADYDETALALSEVTDATDVAAGDILTFQSLHVGTGIADPGGTVQIEITRS